jgi:hypothetical protein
MYRQEMSTAGSSGCGCSGATRPAGRSNQITTSRPGTGCGCGCGGCDACEGLTSLCRPRFFDGQLITASDFRRLDRYIVQKSRLHNRYLHGVGVVCGLEIVCNPCDDTVTARPGYALGPCGEDIVVSCDTSVDVAALIRDHRRQTTRTDCSPYSNPPQDCEAARQKWVLGICYDEQSSRPVTSLRPRAKSCGCGSGSGSCGCGGSGSCGCGDSCGGSCSPSTREPSSCEPTQICEGFRFTLTKVPTSSSDDERVQGELPRRVMECLETLRDAITSIPTQPTPDQLITYCCELKENLRDVIDSGNVHDCTLGQRLNDIACPDINDDQATQKAQSAIVAMLQIAIDVFRSCVCSALLPPCDVACADDCVPLAVLTVRSSDLRVLDICNWSARKFVITMPTLSYWFGWVPIFAAIRNVIVRLCCDQTRRQTFRVDNDLRVSALDTQGFATFGSGAPPEGQAEEAAAQPGAADRVDTAATDETSFVALGMQYAGALSSLSGLEATVLGALGAKSESGEALATPLELANPLAALSLAQIGAPAGASVLPPELLDRLRDRGGDVAEPGGAKPTVTVTDERVAGLEETLAKLQKTVDTQAKTIRSLQRKGPDK